MVRLSVFILVIKTVHWQTVSIMGLYYFMWGNVAAHKHWYIFLLQFSIYSSSTGTYFYCSSVFTPKYFFL